MQVDPGDAEIGACREKSRSLYQRYRGKFWCRSFALLRQLRNAMLVRVVAPPYLRFDVIDWGSLQNDCGSRCRNEMMMLGADGETVLMRLCIVIALAEEEDLVVVSGGLIIVV